jgi:hypothetical protein
LFYHAVEAYENGDLNGLRVISEMAAEPAIHNVRYDGLAQLHKEKERLDALLQNVKTKSQRSSRNIRI